jgi:hypothetical protein
MKDILQALDRALERGEVKPARALDIRVALERAAAEALPKPVSLSTPRLPRIVRQEAAPVRVAVRSKPAPADQPDERPLRGLALRDEMNKLRAAEPDREPWPDSWFTHTDAGDGHRCLQMWAECLRICLVEAADQTCKDYEAQAAWDAKPEKLRKGPRPIVRSSWIRTSDFMQVCALAGLDGQAVLDRVAPKLATHLGAAELGMALSGAARRGFANTRSSFGHAEDAA